MQRRTFAALAAALVLSACAGSRTQESTGEYIDDATLTTKVKTALANDSLASAGAVTVETFKGVVQLSGFVDSEAEKRRAAQLAWDVIGVRSVKNDIRVKPR